MKRAISVVLTSLLLLLIQSSPAYDLIRISLGAKPDLLLIFLAFLSFKYGSFNGVIYGFIIGLMQDVVSNSTFGSYAIIFLILGFFNSRIFVRQITAGIFITLVGYLIKIIGLFLVISIYSDLSNVAVLIRSELFIGLPLTVILSSPMFLIFYKISYLLYDKNKIHVEDNAKNYEE